MIKPTQADIQAARYFWAKRDPNKCYQYMEGTRDTYPEMVETIQSFASHAEQARLQERERCARIVETWMIAAQSSPTTKVRKLFASAIRADPVDAATN